MTDQPYKEFPGAVPDEVAAKITMRINWIFFYYDPNADFFPTSPSSCPGCVPDDDRFSQIYLRDHCFSLAELDGSEVLQFSVEDSLEIWRTWLSQPVSDARFERVTAWTRDYVQAEQTREDEWVAGVQEARAEALLNEDEDEDDDEELDPDPEGYYREGGGFSRYLKLRDDGITDYQIRQAIRAETVDAEERKEIFSRIQHAECYRLVSRPDAEDSDSDPGFSEAAAKQERERLIRERAESGENMTPEDRAALTVRIIQLGG